MQRSRCRSLDGDIAGAAFSAKQGLNTDTIWDLAAD